MTPINNLAISEQTVDWNKYHVKWAKLDEPLRRVADRVGVSERFIIQRLAGQNGLASNGETLNVSSATSQIVHYFCLCRHIFAFSRHWCCSNW